MKVNKIIMSLMVLVGMAQAGTELIAQFQGVAGNNEAEINTMIKKIDSIGFSSVAVNTHIENFYFKKFQEKGVEMLSFYGIKNDEKLRPLLLANPDFGAYAPFNFLVYKTLDKKADDNTWFGHLGADTMLDIIGEKDPALRKDFTDMLTGWDKFAAKELKPTKTKKFERTAALPTQGLTKLIKKFDKPDDLEEFIEELIGDHDGRFAKHNFIIAGFVDFKFEYDDQELEFDKYDAYWVSLLCHFEFSNSIFNRGTPEAGMFAPCSVYFYIPKGTNEVHVGFASVENWISGLNMKDEKQIKSMRAIDAEVVEVFKEMGFELVKQ
ncbi:MAG: hypothetical protein Q9M39_05730 [Sulfurovum sp.]|nr:hypothetical protein [Sulfurovum sp.]